MIKKTVKEADIRICRDIVETTVLDKCWSQLEYGRIMLRDSNWRYQPKVGHRDLTERSQGGGRGHVDGGGGCHQEA